MTVYTTSKGRQIDMSALVSKNETVRAVGNMKVNARGDQIDSQGRIITPVNEMVTDMYAKTVANAGAIANHANPVPHQAKLNHPLTVEEQELENDQENDMIVEQIKKAENGKSKKR